MSEPLKVAARSARHAANYLEKIGEHSHAVNVMAVTRRLSKFAEENRRLRSKLEAQARERHAHSGRTTGDP